MKVHVNANVAWFNFQQDYGILTAHWHKDRKNMGGDRIFNREFYRRAVLIFRV